jgi:hypothetical protein
MYHCNKKTAHGYPDVDHIALSPPNLPSSKEYLSCALGLISLCSLLPPSLPTILYSLYWQLRNHKMFLYHEMHRLLQLQMLDLPGSVISVLHSVFLQHTLFRP